MSAKNYIDHEKRDNSITKGSRNYQRRQKGLLSHLSYAFGMVILSFAAYTVIFKYAQDTPNISNHEISVLEEPCLSPTNNKKEDSYKLRHIFHHNPMLSKAARLDITDQFISSHDLHLPQPYLEPSQVFEEGINDIGSSSMDSNIPIYFASESQWTHQFNMKSNDLETIRLMDRSPDSVESYLNYAFEVGQEEVNKISLDWAAETVSVPDVTDRDTVINLALMASNAYVDIPETGDWKDLDESSYYNETEGFGWLGDGLRGHIFTNQDNSSVIISIKGTSAAGLNTGADGETSPNDKLNDNLLFSCCCARVSYMWSTVCDCYEGSYTCNQRCLERELQRPDRYYKSVLQLYRNVTHMYPNSKNIWVTGHSLGGALSSLLGRTFGLPAVTFEAPAELLATRRLHLPMPPGLSPEMEHIWHFGNTADPIFMGVCNGASSTCAVAGYAMETQCHSGKQCIYDVVSDLGWHVNLLNHRIHTVIDDIILQYNSTPVCETVPPCHDCFNWNFVDDQNKGRKSSSSSKIITSTTSKSVSPTYPSDDRKCLKRTWYGRCYEWEDDDTDSSSSTFGDKTTQFTYEPSDFLNTTLKTKTVTRTKDKNVEYSSSFSSSSSSSSSSFSSSSISESPEHKCISWSWLGYCLKYDDDDESTTTTTASVTSSTVSVTTTDLTTTGEQKCIEYNWYGACKKYGPI